MDHYLNELLAEGEVEVYKPESFYCYEMFTMTPDKLILTLGEIAADHIKCKPFTGHFSFEVKYWVEMVREYVLSLSDPSAGEGKWRNALEKFLSEEFDDVFLSENTSYHTELAFVVCLPKYEAWRPLYNALPLSLKFEALSFASYGIEYNLAPAEPDSVSRKDGAMVVPSFAASLISKFRDSGSELKENDSSFSELMDRIDKASRTVPVPSKKLKAELRDYQLSGFRWLSRLSSWAPVAVLSDDMGLGKTVQAIALLFSRAKDGASLVVAPASVMPNWKKELARFAPSLNVLTLNDSGADRERIVSDSGKSDIVLTTYGVAQKEDELIAGKHWNAVVLDEAHAIKNSETKTSQAIMRIRSGFNLLLTGTPVQNNLLELWNLFNFATPGLLGSKDHFLANASQLKRLILPFILRRTKEQVLEELPPKTEITMAVQLSDGERALCESLRRDAEKTLSEGEHTLFDALAVLTKLRLACCHPALVQENIGIGSSKSDAFMNLVGELMENVHRALVFSQFTSHLAQHHPG